jgi:spermidine/putrescine transport system substrate-binding protein
MALKILGYSINTTDEAQVKQAYDLLAQLKPGIAVFNSDAPRQPFMNKEVVIGLIWSGEVFLANTEAGKKVMDFVYPKEGPMPWVDSMVIPKNAPNKAGAHKFINFILKPEIGKMISESVGYATPNREARHLLPGDVKANPVVYPPEALIEQAEFTNDLGPAIAVYEKYWELLKTKK